MSAAGNYTVDYVTSSDGVKIGYRQFGKGEQVILVHGGMMYSQNLMKLGKLLAGDFAIIIPDRRSRGLSSTNHHAGLAVETADLQAIVTKTGAKNIYGLSAGAVITLQTALIEKTIEKIALHEPPILTDETKAIGWIDKYNAAIQKGNYGKAFVSVINGTDDPSSLLNRVPAFMIAPLLNIVIENEASKIEDNTDSVPLKNLLAAMSYDIQVVKDSIGLIEKAKDLDAEVLLLKGQKSQPYLKSIIDLLSESLPAANRVTLEKQGHTVSDNGGKPELVAAELKKFFAADKC